MFLAHRGVGAFVTPLSAAPAAAGTPLSQLSGRGSSGSEGVLTRIRVRDTADTGAARFMESYESRHSDHSFTAAVVRACVCACVRVRACVVGGCWVSSEHTACLRHHKPRAGG
jgi:hypothetical protein